MSGYSSVELASGPLNLSIDHSAAPQVAYAAATNSVDSRGSAGLNGASLGSDPGPAQGTSPSEDRNNAGDVLSVSGPEAGSPISGNGTTAGRVTRKLESSGLHPPQHVKVSVDGLENGVLSEPRGTSQGASISGMGSAPDPPMYIPAGAALLASLDGTGQMESTGTASLPISRSVSLRRNAAPSLGGESPASPMPAVLDNGHPQIPLEDSILGTNQGSDAQGRTGTDARAGPTLPSLPHEGGYQAADHQAYELPGNRQGASLTGEQDVTAGPYAVSRAYGSGPRMSDLGRQGPSSHQDADSARSLHDGSQPKTSFDNLPQSQPFAVPSTGHPEQLDPLGNNLGSQTFGKPQSVPEASNSLQHSRGPHQAQGTPDSDFNYGAPAGHRPMFHAQQHTQPSDRLPGNQDLWNATQGPRQWDQVGASGSGQDVSELDNRKSSQEWATDPSLTFASQQGASKNWQHSEPPPSSGLNQSSWTPNRDPGYGRQPFDMRPPSNNPHHGQAVRNSAIGQGDWTTPPLNLNYRVQSLGDPPPGYAGRDGSYPGNSNVAQNSWMREGDPSTLHYVSQHPGAPSPHSFGQDRLTPGNSGVGQGSGPPGWGSGSTCQPRSQVPPPEYGYHSRWPETTGQSNVGQRAAFPDLPFSAEMGYNARNSRSVEQNGEYPGMWDTSSAPDPYAMRGRGGPPGFGPAQDRRWPDSPQYAQNGDFSARDDGWRVSGRQMAQPARNEQQDHSMDAHPNGIGSMYPGAGLSHTSQWGRDRGCAGQPPFQMRAPDSPDSVSTDGDPHGTGALAAPWNSTEALQALVQESESYGAGITRWRQGQADAQTLIGVELPLRLAAEGLGSVASMSGKVQETLIHFERAYHFNARRKMMQLMQHAWSTWKSARQNSMEKKQVNINARSRLRKGTLARTFSCWHSQVLHSKRQHTKLQKHAERRGEVMIRHCFASWQSLLEERHWKRQVAMRDDRLAFMEAQVNRWERHCVHILQRTHLRRVFAEFLMLCKFKADKKLQKARAEKQHRLQCIHGCLVHWHTVTEERRQKREARSQILEGVAKAKCKQVWNAWRQVRGQRLQHVQRQHDAQGVRNSRLMSDAWYAWQEHHRMAKCIQAQLHSRAASATKGVLHAWLSHVTRWQHLRQALAAMSSQWHYRSLQRHWRAWVEQVQVTRYNLMVKRNKEQAAALAAAQGTIEKLQDDNAKMLRIMAGEEWTRRAVSNLCETGQLLHEGHVNLRNAVDDLKVSSKTQLPLQKQPKKPPAAPLLVKNASDSLQGPLARNRMLIRNGSSFNAVVRALKQDLLENAATEDQDSTLMYEVDKLSLNQVHILQDGQLSVQAVASRPWKSAAIARR